jgi:hypothetical protein
MAEEYVLPEPVGPAPTPEYVLPEPIGVASAEEEDEQGVIESVGRGIVTAPISLAQGIVELGAIGLDSAFETNTLRPVTDWFSGIKENIEPTGTAGRVTEEVVGFGPVG